MRSNSHPGLPDLTDSARAYALSANLPMLTENHPQQTAPQSLTSNQEALNKLQLKIESDLNQVSFWAVDHRGAFDAEGREASGVAGRIDLAAFLLGFPL